MVRYIFAIAKSPEFATNAPVPGSGSDGEVSQLISDKS